MPSNTFWLEILTPERSFFSGQAEQVTVTGLDGKIGVLKGHTPMVSSLGIGEVQIKQNGVWLTAACSEGFMRTDPDYTLILVQTAEWPEEIDVNRAMYKKEQAEEKLRQKESMREFTSNRNTLAKAVMRIRVGGKNSVNQ